MEREKQYQLLLEIVAKARILSANSDEDTVLDSVERIKNYGIISAVSLGYSEAKFKSDSLKLYKEYIEIY
jgi:hypothetical protein